MPRRTLWIMLAVAVFSLACYERADHNRYGRWFSEVLETIDRHYLEPVDDQKLFEGALGGMVRSLDDYSAFLPRSEASGFQEALDQHYGGVGIEVTLDPSDRQLTVMNLMAGSPAARSGLKSGDKIISVDGQPTAKMELNDVVRLLRGKPGAAVNLGVRRGDEEKQLDFQLVRAVIQIDSVRGFKRTGGGDWNFFLPGDDHLGYVRIESFGESTVDEFEAAMQQLTKGNCRGAIIDLRNNPGGLLDAAEEICDLFLPAGKLIVSTRGRNGRGEKDYLATGRGPYQELPLVVLIDDRSASASEIVAACLQDHQRATIVGQRSWGKGTVQNVIPLEGGKSLLKLTIASYWRPSGKNIHRTSKNDDWGVTPDADCEVKLDEGQQARWFQRQRQRDRETPGETASAASATPASADAAPPPSAFDPQLERAIEVLKEKLGTAGKPAAA